MLVGELLKKYRTEKMKTQKQWAGNVISPSFYAKVEKNIHRITVDDLIELLHYNKISIFDFFSKLDRQEQNQNAFKKEITNQIVEAYYHHSKEELEEIRKIINESDLPDKEEQLTFIEAYIALLSNNLEDLDNDIKTKIKNKLFNISDYNENNLYLYCNFMSFYDLDSNLLLAKRLVKHFQDNSNVGVQEAILSIIVNLLIFCIKDKNYDKTLFFIKASKQIQNKPRLVFYKDVLVVLENMINYHYQPDDEYLDNIGVIIKSFSLIGMKEYGQELATFVEKNK